MRRWSRKSEIVTKQATDLQYEYVCHVIVCVCARLPFPLLSFDSHVIIFLVFVILCVNRLGSLVLANGCGTHVYFIYPSVHRQTELNGTQFMWNNNAVYHFMYTYRKWPTTTATTTTAYFYHWLRGALKQHSWRQLDSRGVDCVKLNSYGVCVWLGLHSRQEQNKKEKRTEN